MSARPHAGLGLVTTVRATGRGLILLAGPSSCGKGAIALALRRTLQLPAKNHVSMGEVLRTLIDDARRDATFRATLGWRYGVHADRGVLDEAATAPEVIVSAKKREAELVARYGAQPSQLDWLEHCVTRGLLVPDKWSERILEGAISDRRDALVLLDGYPRSEAAASHVLELSERLQVPILHVIHLSIGKREMQRRALGRQRSDDTPESLERRYQFYIDHVQPAMELLKQKLGGHTVALIDAHQPAYRVDGSIDLEASVRAVASAVMVAMGVSRQILEHLEERSLTAPER